MKTIIIFGPEGPNSGAEGVVTAKFMNMMQNQGWEVFWIYHNTNTNYYDSKTNTDHHLIGIKNPIIQKMVHALHHIPILKYVYHLDSIFWCYKAYKKGKSIHKKKTVDYIFSRIMPQYGHLPALLLKRKKNIPWIANWSDPMPRSKAPYPYGMGVDSPISTFQQCYLKEICKYANAHTFPSTYLKKFYLHYLPVKPEKSFTLSHIIDKDIIEIPQKHKILKLAHIGGGLIQRDPTLFFKALRNIINKKEFSNISIQVDFVGPIEGNVEQISKNTKIDHVVHFVGKRPYNEALEYIKQADILLIIEAPMEEGIFLPSKVTDVLGYHKPMFSISPKKGVLKDLITQFKGGLVVDCLSLTEIENGLEQLLSDWNLNQLQTPQYDTKELYHEFSEKNIWNHLQNIIHNI